MQPLALLPMPLANAAPRAALPATGTGILLPLASAALAATAPAVLVRAVRKEPEWEAATGLERREPAVVVLARLGRPAMGEECVEESAVDVAPLPRCRSTVTS